MQTDRRRNECKLDRALSNFTLINEFAIRLQTEELNKSTITKKEMAELYFFVPHYCVLGNFS